MPTVHVRVPGFKSQLLHHLSSVPLMRALGEGRRKTRVRFCVLGFDLPQAWHCGHLGVNQQIKKTISLSPFTSHFSSPCPISSLSSPAPLLFLDWIPVLGLSHHSSQWLWEQMEIQPGDGRSLHVDLSFIYQQKTRRIKVSLRSSVLGTALSHSCY